MARARRTPEQNRAIYERRQQLARDRGFSSYGRERRAREAVKGTTGEPAARGATQRDLARAHLHKHPALAKAITGSEPKTRADWTAIYSP